MIACQRIGGEEIIVGEDRNAVPSERYLCCYVERNELMELYTHGLASDGYAEIFEIYGQRITTAAKNAIEKTDEEKAVIGGEDRVITVDKCRRISGEDNLINKPVDVSVTAENRIKGMIGIRDCVRTLIEYQTEDYPESDIKAEQEKLNELYDAFSKKYGLINSGT